MRGNKRGEKGVKPFMSVFGKRGSGLRETSPHCEQSDRVGEDCEAILQKRRRKTRSLSARVKKQVGA